MAVRGLKGSILKHPVRSIECLYVPIMMSAARRADELSSAAVTRGIENPKERTTLIDVRLHWTDFVIMVMGTCVVFFCIGRF
jgi:energy-coupling factor transport system permease protein